MRDCIKTVLKLFLIGLITTGVRIVGQLLIPAGTQTVLAPSSFAQNGTMPLAFTLYGIFAYSVFAAMFLLIRERMDGNRLWQGISYSLACCAVWVTYLWEPLPHVAAMDRITYPIADSLALIVMGLFLGRMFGKERAKAEKRPRTYGIFPMLGITAAFLVGRLFLYFAADIYASFAEQPLETLLWCLITGWAVACVMAWMSRFVAGGRIKRAVLLGGVLFGVDLLLFNFFMPLVFAADVPDLLLRTLTDAVSVTVGCLFLPGREEMHACYSKSR
ncbi:MAG TPA: hypothetical protein H9705_08710 [Candidatus Fusicatenibacter intestinigallinarum]|uniref:Uncharacterized protein n=1 Tax=Candidatus Fusicatenibacter intestinigallinarum TaxID=2838598 RepID=A0A9D2ND67_9FIRM|nr:hypothetical protein [Candidatus Fusicatenibacter intestinigallinarum]